MSTDSHDAADRIRKQGDLAIDHVVTSGTFALDGGEWDVDNNIWVFGNDDEVIVVDAAHAADPIIDAVGGRRVKAIVCTHAHNDHITVAPELSEKLDAPILVHPGDQMLWEQTWGDLGHDTLKHGQKLEVAGTEVVVVNTPGHSPGSCCLYVPEAGELFSGDTLFSGGPGATGRSYSDFDTIIDSIRDNLLTLPEDTIVRTGHGDHTTIGREAPHLEEWIRRGH
ncbi:MBL fold metallo-hydrolase [uncultured Corynebacterium sp.]|uniref:MBL fold metallo-hydrolase n=1 Tax=uncultured Corynebacterium sp. TaxID=159447 RepID=UPI0025E808BD|nr:MBL fold metallo-hydrolase [uncultured Corynebacterium sp.]